MNLNWLLYIFYKTSHHVSRNLAERLLFVDSPTTIQSWFSCLCQSEAKKIANHPLGLPLCLPHWRAWYQSSHLLLAANWIWFSLLPTMFNNFLFFLKKTCLWEMEKEELCNKFGSAVFVLQLDIVWASEGAWVWSISMHFTYSVCVCFFKFGSLPFGYVCYVSCSPMCCKVELKNLFASPPQHCWLTKKTPPVNLAPPCNCALLVNLASASNACLSLLEPCNDIQ